MTAELLRRAGRSPFGRDWRWSSAMAV